MPQCSAIKRDGTRCTASVRPGDEWCWNHSPANADKRRRNASRAGKTRPSREITSIKAQLAEMVETVLSGTVSTAPYAVANQLLNTRLRAIEIERKVRETDDLERRLEELERAAGEQPKGETKWRA